ncbi:Toxin-antitoxin system, toxin component, PIN family [Candidatus Methylobacter favarea]|uniref:Toxin-antitoxin system, toxin component, PIN family n=1 Tax=Candidatus Methylobacter favarea TaxID=2707345 RepID=A0A8S0XQP4_9GAMM|nr:type II toxin-antitoxin system VapC family toxin [Candidatus Methylobacter favarea]CAA9889457.1 Toxin-antitoxin system, toxin component, PIN family [Candidatus Methylobacter favarea]
MKVLLDTCAFLWLVTDDPKLSALAKEIFLDSGNELLLSAASGFEITIKYSLGKLHLTEPPKEFIANRVQANALTEMSISMNHTYALQSLPLHHQDPFDRLLVAQAMVNRIPLLSPDEQLSAYAITRLW